MAACALLLAVLLTGKTAGYAHWQATSCRNELTLFELYHEEPENMLDKTVQLLHLQSCCPLTWAEQLSDADVSFPCRLPVPCCSSASNGST
jgi:hypothetical protein